MPSSVIKFAVYHADDRALDVRFRSGKTYRYIDVPQGEYDAYRAAFSKGQFLNAVIKKKYDFIEL